MNKRPERRDSPRIEKVLSISLKGDGFAHMTETKNISASGATCEVSQPIPELSKLRVTLWVPDEIHCTGIVVRSEKMLHESGTPSTYRIAIYFTEMGPKHREKLWKLIYGSD